MWIFREALRDADIYLPVPSAGVQLTFLMNSPYVPASNVCRLRAHFGNVVNQSVPPRAVLYPSTPNIAIGPREEMDWLE